MVLAELINTKAMNFQIQFVKYSEILVAKDLFFRTLRFRTNNYKLYLKNRQDTKG